MTRVYSYLDKRVLDSVTLQELNNNEIFQSEPVTLQELYNNEIFLSELVDEDDIVDIDENVSKVDLIDNDEDIWESFEMDTNQRFL